jgi:hypothetical protein
MAKRKPKFQKFEIPDSFLDQIFELTGGLNKHKGYVLCYIDENGDGQIKHKYDSQASEFAINKFLEIYVNQYESELFMQNTSRDFPDDCEEDD